MKPWTVEYGTFWVWEEENGLPPSIMVRIEAQFKEIKRDGLSNLAKVLDRSGARVAGERLEAGRRCFTLQADGEVICYGWVTHGPEFAGELEREFNINPNEAYIWDCSTLPEWRRKGLYSALLSRIIRQLDGEKVTRAWIGASRLNRPSVHGIANAGFRKVVDLTYRRVLFLVVMSLQKSPQAPARLVNRAAQILLKRDERRLGRFAVGVKT